LYWFGRFFKNLYGYYMGDVIWIKTHRYSEFLKRLFAEYNENIEIEIGGRLYAEKDIHNLIKDWCTNQNIRKTIDFTLKKNGTPLFGFHDTPDDFWAAMSERPFIEQLASEKIVRYKVSQIGYKRNYASYIFFTIAILVLIAIVLFLARRVFPER